MLGESLLEIKSWWKILILYFDSLRHSRLCFAGERMVDTEYGGESKIPCRLEGRT